MKRAPLVVAALSGFVLALALAFGKLTRPEVIIGWVDFFGQWNPHLLWFFLSGVVVYHLFTRLEAWQKHRSGGEVCTTPNNGRIDARLVVGSTIFGVGWAIGGACPGPALTSLGAGATWAPLLVGAMALGLKLGDYVRRDVGGGSVSRARRSPSDGSAYFT